jgi:hypothetical protein
VTVSGSVKVPICEPGATVQLVTALVSVVVDGPEPATSPSSLVPQATNARQSSDDVKRAIETVCGIEKGYHAHLSRLPALIAFVFDLDTRRLSAAARLRATFLARRWRRLEP